MSIFFDTFSNKISNLFHLAHKLNKPIHPRLTWTYGIINGRADFLDLQAHGIALAASIIIQESVIPKIICGWDFYETQQRLNINPKLKDIHYPKYILSHFSDPEVFDNPHVSDIHPRETRYMSLYRSSQSVNTQPWSLGVGYRAKYHGLEYVTTSHAIMSDIDTICMKPCISILDSEIDKDSNTFCLTNWHDWQFISVGLIVLNMQKYRNIFKPYFNRIYWDTGRADSKFIKNVINKYPELQSELDIRLFDKVAINAERFSTCETRGNIYEEDKTSHYHSWKHEMDSEEFVPFYDSILNNLEQSAKSQLAESQNNGTRIS